MVSIEDCGSSDRSSIPLEGLQVLSLKPPETYNTCLPQSRTVSSKANEIDIYEYDKQLGWVYNLLKKEISVENFNLVQKYDTYMVKDGLAKGTRLKHLKMVT